MGTAGQDFGEYRQWLDAAGVDTSLVRQVPDKFTASFFCSTDTENNQIASFYTGAMANAAELSFRTIERPGLVIVSPNDPAAMMQYAEECRALKIPFIFDPGQQCARMSGAELRDGIDGARLVICNDYEFELIRQKTGDGRRRRAEGGGGADHHARRGRVLDLPDGQPDRREGGAAVADRRSDRRRRRVPRRPDEGNRARRPVSDLCAGRERGGDICAGAPRGQSHAYTPAEFKARAEAHFGPLRACSCNEAWRSFSRLHGEAKVSGMMWTTLSGRLDAGKATRKVLMVWSNATSGTPTRARLANARRR